MNFEEKHSALETVRNLIEACGAQTKQQLVNELRLIATGCNNLYKAESYVNFALQEFRGFGVLKEEELEGEIFYELI